MLPPQARSGLSAVRSNQTSLHLRSMTQVRHFWPFHCRKPTDWTSHLDPHYIQLHRRRYLNTRAKLLKNLRRRSKWEWDCEQRPFFSSKQIRLASHWYGNGNGNRSKWPKGTEQEKERPGENEDGGDGYELSARERIWKEHMEKMRKRIEEDPYEAVFGKRFEPFWSPLVPSWMREEMGLHGWQKRTQQAVKKTDPDSEPKKQTPRNTETKSTPQPNNYAFSSSTSWDSWTNKTTKREWDSVSGETKHYEYDPISNRMVVISTPQKPQQTALAERKPVELQHSQQQRSTDIVTRGNASDNKPSSPLRKAITIPHFVEPAIMSTPTPSVAPTTAFPLSDEIDGITADSIRKMMGKRRSQDHAQIDALLQERNQSDSEFPAMSEWDHAEQVCMLEHEIKSLKAKREALANDQRHVLPTGDIERQQEHLENRIRDAAAELQSLDQKWIDHTETPANVSQSEAADKTVPKTQNVAHLQTALQRGAMAPKHNPGKTLQSAVERMQSKPAPAIAEYDDAAAHESTEASPYSVPDAWNQQADLLQTDRVKRTTTTRPYLYPVPRWVDEMADREAEREAARAASMANPAEQRRSTKLAKASEMLASEIEQQKLAMKLHEERRAAASFDRGQSKGPVSTEPTSMPSDSVRVDSSKDVELKYKAKVAALKKELDIAYRQSSTHADEFRDQIRKAENLAGKTEQAKTLELKSMEDKYKSKVAALKKEVDVAYQQSSFNADEFRDRIRKLEMRVAKGQSTAGDRQSTIDAGNTQRIPLKEMQGEGDFCMNVTKYTGSNRWYKGPCSEPKTAATIKQEESDRALAQEVRRIYEAAYGTIGQEQNATLGLDRSLNRFEKSRTYGFKEDGLENELVNKVSTARSAGKEETSKSYRSLEDSPDRELGSKANEPLVKDIKSGVYQFRDDNLEAELAGKSGMEKASTDAAALDSKSYGFENDGLGNELAARRKQQSNRRNLRERLASELTDVSTMLNEVRYGRTSGTTVNPVDGTAAGGAPATGNYASPTGFVNHDPVFPRGGNKQAGVKNSSEEEAFDHDVEYVHYPRVKREERVFSGWRRVRPSRFGAYRDRHDKQGRWRRRRRFWLRLLTLPLGFGMLVSVFFMLPMYLIGVLFERRDINRNEKQEAWDRVVREFEANGEKGVVKAVKEMHSADGRNGSGLFWK